MPSIAAQILVTIIPIVGIVMGSVVLFLYLIFTHKQKVLMIEKGILQKKPLDIDALSLFTGLILLAVGFSLSLFYLIKEGISYGLLSGILPFSIGISVLLFFIIRRKLNISNNDK